MSEAVTYDETPPAIHAEPDIEKLGSVIPLFGDNASSEEPTKEPVSGSRSELLITPELDIFIEEKAADFYGMKALSSTPMSRMRFLNKALQKMPGLSEQELNWIDKFKAEDAAKKGNVALHHDISVPVPPKVVTDEFGHVTGMTDWTTRNAQTLHIFRNPNVRTAVINEMAVSGDKSAHVIRRVEQWRSRQKISPSETEIIGANRAFEQLLFGIKGIELSKLVESIVRKQYNNLDITS